MIWAFFLMSVVVYAALAFLLIEPVEARLDNNLRYIFYLAAFVSLVLSRKFNRASIDALTDTWGDDSQKYLRASVLSFACSDAVAVFGLVSYILFGKALDLVLLVGVSIVSLVLHYPKGRRDVVAP